MFQRGFFLFSSLLILASCSNSELLSDSGRNSRENELAGSTVEIPQASAETLLALEQLVIESLFIEAGDLGQQPISDEQGILSLPQTSEAIEEIIHSPEPVTPTVAMTANEIVEREINDYLLNRRTLLRLWIERGETYFPMIEKIFAEEGIPDELKYVALGESGLRPLARSGAGAAGMWQFMPATGRGAGLIVNNWIDERLDPEKATRAAAHHFKELYKSYNGNWHLVLAGYNCSYRCISRAVRRAGGSIETPPSFWEIYSYLPRETRGFIPKFIAASLIVSNPDMYGITIDSPGPDYHYDVVDINGMLSLEDAAMLANTEIKTIRNLNPSIRRSSLPASDSSFALKIPFNGYDSFVEAFTNLSEEAKIPPGEYVVKSGDTLSKIARHFEMSIDELKRNNGLQGSLIHPGQQLLIPGSGSSVTSIASNQRSFIQYGQAQYRPIKLGDEFELIQQPDFSEENPFMMVNLTNPDINTIVVPTIYTVRSGDTLSRISARFDVSISDIQSWNNVRGTTIFPNQELTLHSLITTASIGSYQVKSGDNLGSIARRFGVTIDNIKRWNGLNNNLIFPGQNLQLN